MGYHIDTEVQISQLLQQLTLMVYYFTLMLYGPKLSMDVIIRADLMHQITYYSSLDKISVILALFDYKPQCYRIYKICSNNLLCSVNFGDNNFPC